MLDGKARHMGLGAVETFSLKEARERARQARQLIADGVDPLAERESKRETRKAAKAKRLTFKEAATKYIAGHSGRWRNEKHGEQWANTLATYAYPHIGELDVAPIDKAHIVNVLDPIWKTKTETASRVRGRIEKVLGWAIADGYRTGLNPARWRDHLEHSFPARRKVAKPKSHAAMPHTAIGAFMQRLREQTSISARALEFTILTAARTGEAIGAR